MEPSINSEVGLRASETVQRKAHKLGGCQERQSDPSDIFGRTFLLGLPEDVHPSALPHRLKKSAATILPGHVQGLVLWSRSLAVGQGGGEGHRVNLKEIASGFEG